MTETHLDAAHAAMEAAPDDAAARLRFYDRLSAAELFLLLETEAEGDNIAPAVFPVDGQSFVLVFDRQDRMTAFAGAPAPYAALSGRALAGMLAGQGLGLGVNLSVAPSSILIPAEAVEWLAEMLKTAAREVAERPVSLSPPTDLPPGLLQTLDARLAAAAGLAASAWLAAVNYQGGRPGHMLVFVGAEPGAEGALTQLVSEALAFSGIEAGTLDVAFVEAPDPFAAKLAKVGLRFDIPEPAAPAEQRPPGSDPDRPPILR